MRPEPLRGRASLSKTVRRTDTLERAWRQVRSNALNSDSTSTVQEALEFDTHAAAHLRRIQRQLLNGRFVFRPAKGVLIKKKGKAAKRPVVIAPVESRIVQRALLDVLHGLPALHARLNAGHNFGGLCGPKAGVPAAVAQAVAAAGAHGYYIRTDIKAFFTQVPRETAVAAVLEYVDDPAFAALFKLATDTELADMGGYTADDLALFPLAEAGVAQGSCLSPLLCNLLLASFDEAMNSRDVRCIRYIDDFIVFAPRRAVATTAFKRALKLLGALGLSAYDPFSSDPDECRKADHGTTANGFEFLGCDIRPTRVRPARANCKQLLDRVHALFNQALLSSHRATGLSLATDDRSCISFADALVAASNAVRGWGNTYQFCSDDRLMANLDLEIGKEVLAFYNSFRSVAPALKARGLLGSALGMFLLRECKRDDSKHSARTIALQALQRRQNSPAPPAASLVALDGKNKQEDGSAHVVATA